MNHGLPEEFIEVPLKEETASERALAANIQLSEDGGSKMQGSVRQATILVIQYLVEIMNRLIEKFFRLFSDERIQKVALQIR